MAVPLAGAMAQQPAQTGDAVNNRPSPAANNPKTPGATGRSVVPGDKSTIAGNKAATADTKSGGTGAASSGGGSN